jgi:hypothetical protein
MTQALYAHMNNKKIKIKKQKTPVKPISHRPVTKDEHKTETDCRGKYKKVF